MTNDENVEIINGYVEWLREKQMYPDSYSPEEYIHLKEMSACFAKITVLKAYLNTSDEPSIEQIKEIVYE